VKLIANEELELEEKNKNTIIRYSNKLKLTHFTLSPLNLGPLYKSRTM